MSGRAATNLALSGVMLVTKKLQKYPSGGRELLCKLNHEALSEIFGERLVLFELPSVRKQGFSSIVGALRGDIDGLNDDVVAKAHQAIQAQNVGRVFVDGSNLGKLVRVITQTFPQIEVITFFHNVEARFFLGAFRQTKTPRALAVLIVNYLAERKSVRFSNKIICLNERDSLLLNRIYGRVATHISPIALRDNLTEDYMASEDNQQEKFALFVGGVFYANLAGITWFVKNVVPRINVKTYIVGKGFEALRGELEVAGKVEVVGEVENLDVWYHKSFFVVAPIFDGSGMKTKVAEALMFGKKILGTPEAFSGYEAITNVAGRVCNSSDDFVAAIEAMDSIVSSPFDNELRAAYELTYSYEAARTRLKAIMSE